MAKVSVIIPVYNAEKYLNTCISSIANQTMNDIEILAINDGSTDNSLKVLEELQRKYSRELKYLTKKMVVMVLQEMLDLKMLMVNLLNLLMLLII